MTEKETNTTKSILNLDNRHIAVFSREHRNASNGTIYFLHGVGGSSKVWRFQMDFFYLKGYDVFSIDLPGHGASPIPCPGCHRETIDRKSADLEPYIDEACICNDPTGTEFRDAFTFDRLAHDILLAFDVLTNGRGNTMNTVVAHSYGANLAIHLAHERQLYVHRLVLISGGGPVPLYPRTWANILPSACINCLWPLIVRQFQRKAFIKLESTHHKEKADASQNAQFKVANKTTTRFLPDDVNHAFALSSHVFHAVLLGQFWPEGNFQYHSEVEVPTLLLHGDGDQFVELDEETEMLQALPASTLRVIYGAGHMVMLEQPDLVNRHIENTIRNPPPFVWPPRSRTASRSKEGEGNFFQQNSTTTVLQPSAVPIVEANHLLAFAGADDQTLRMRLS